MREFKIEKIQANKTRNISYLCKTKNFPLRHWETQVNVPERLMEGQGPAVGRSLSGCPTEDGEVPEESRPGWGHWRKSCLVSIPPLVKELWGVVRSSEDGVGGSWSIRVPVCRHSQGWGRERWGRRAERRGSQTTALSFWINPPWNPLDFWTSRGVNWCAFWSFPMSGVLASL